MSANSPNCYSSASFQDSPISESRFVIQPKPPSTSKVYKLFGRFQPLKSYSRSLTTYSKLDKLIKFQRRGIAIQEDLIRELDHWSENIPNDTGKTVLNELSNCLELQRQLEDELLHRKENLRLQLVGVQKRESKAISLKQKYNKLYTLLREQESKNGETSYTSLTRENLEELGASVAIVEEQYLRSVNTQLRTSIMDYMISLSSNCQKLKILTDQILATVSTLRLPTTKSTDSRIKNQDSPKYRHADAIQLEVSRKTSSSEVPNAHVSNQRVNSPPSSSGYVDILRNHFNKKKPMIAIPENNEENRSKCTNCNNAIIRASFINSKSNQRHQKICASCSDALARKATNLFTENRNSSDRKLTPGNANVSFPTNWQVEDHWKR